MDQLVETVVRPVKQTRQVIAPATVAPVEKPAATETVAQGNSSAQRERSRSPARGKPEEECDGDAHCFYNCVAAGYALQLEGKDSTTVQPQVSSRGRGLREQIATHIQKHAKDYRHWRPAEDLGNNAVQIEDGDSLGTFEDYIAALFRPKRWADELAWRAAARRLGVRHRCYPRPQQV
jgi:hypothetical protein